MSSRKDDDTAGRAGTGESPGGGDERARRDDDLSAPSPDAGPDSPTELKG